MPKQKPQQHKTYKQSTACLFLNSNIEQYSDYAKKENLDLSEEEIIYINMLYTGGGRLAYVSYILFNIGLICTNPYFIFINDTLKHRNQLKISNCYGMGKVVVVFIDLLSESVKRIL